MDYRTNNIIEEYLTQQLDVFTVDDYSSKSIGEQISKISRFDKKYLAEFGKDAFEYVSKKKSAEHQGKAIISFIQDLIKI